MENSGFYQKNRDAISFLLRGFVIYLVWSLAYRFFLKEAGINDPLTKVVAYLSCLLSNIWDKEISVIYFGTRPYLMKGSQPLVFIDDSCNGLRLYVLFVAFYMALGRFVKELKWIIIGIIGIFILNALRVFGLTMLALHLPGWLDFNHKYTFVIIVYAWILVIWLKSFSKKTEALEQ